jgi:hypothetical protein
MYTPVKTYLHKAQKLFPNKAFLFLINGFLFASLFYFYSEDSYEKQLFKGIAASISKDLPAFNPAKEDSILLRTLDLSYRLLRRRMGIFGNTEFKGINGEMLHPVSFDLMTGKSTCGSGSYVLGRILQEFNMDIRFPQMKVGGEYGGHILVEAKTSDGWKALDPIYNLSFKRPDGQLASFKDVRDNWNYYKQQLPSGYNIAYAYEGVRYTNWNKIPVLMPLLREFLYLVKGKEATDYLSLRSFALRKYNLALNVVLALYVCLCIYMLRLFTVKKKQTLLPKEENKINTKQQPSMAAVYN